jgi:hypothetical protein
MKSALGLFKSASPGTQDEEAAIPGTWLAHGRGRELWVTIQGLFVFCSEEAEATSTQISSAKATSLPVHKQ